MDDAQAHREAVAPASSAGAPSASGAAGVPRQPRSYLWLLLGLLVLSVGLRFAGQLVLQPDDPYSIRVIGGAP